MRLTRNAENYPGNPRKLVKTTLMRTPRSPSTCVRMISRMEFLAWVFPGCGTPPCPSIDTARTPTAKDIGGIVNIHISMHISLSSLKTTLVLRVTSTLIVVTFVVIKILNLSPHYCVLWCRWSGSLVLAPITVKWITKLVNRRFAPSARMISVLRSLWDRRVQAYSIGLRRPTRTKGQRK